jgi:hypothetical protein
MIKLEKLLPMSTRRWLEQLERIRRPVLPVRPLS